MRIRSESQVGLKETGLAGLALLWFLSAIPILDVRGFPKNGFRESQVERHLSHGILEVEISLAILTLDRDHC